FSPAATARRIQTEITTKYTKHTKRDLMLEGRTCRCFSAFRVVRVFRGWKVLICPGRTLLPVCQFPLRRFESAAQSFPSRRETSARCGRDDRGCSAGWCG